MSKLRFCMLTTFYPPYNFGGDGMGIQRLARALVRRGHHVTVIHDVDAYNVLSPRPDPPRLEEPAGLEVVGLRSRMGAVSPFLTQQTGRPVVHGPRIRRLLAEGAYDVIWFHNVSLVGGPGILPLGDTVKIYEAHEHWLVCPTHVLWRHGRELCTGRECVRCVLNHRRPPQLWRFTGQLTRALEHVDAFIAKSEFSRRKHREFGFPREMNVVPYFLPDADPPTPDPSPQAPVHERPFFLFVGRLERIKGLDDVIPVFDAYRDADLLIAGDGEYGATLRALAGDNPRVKFLGRVTPDRLRQYYREAIALVVPSVCFETFGIILIEAFAQGTPVIARRLGPFPEIVERAQGGEIFSTPPELEAALRRLQQDRAYRDGLAESGRAAFTTTWSESAVIPQYLEVVRDAAEAGGRRALVDKLTDELAA